MGEIVVVMRPICTSPFNINSCFLVCRGRGAGILRTISTYINISSVIMRVIVAGQTWPKFMTSAITWGRFAGLFRPTPTTSTTSAINWVGMDGLKRPMSNNLLSWRHFHTVLLRTFISFVSTTGGRMAGLTRPIYYTWIFLHRE